MSRSDTTIAIGRETKEQIDDLRHDGESWDAFVRRVAAEPPELLVVVPRDSDLSTRELSERYTWDDVEVVQDE